MTRTDGDRTTRTRVAAAVVALGAMGLWPTGAGAAPRGVAEPTVIVTGDNGRYVSLTDCKGRDRSGLREQATFTVTRTGPLDADLAVDVAWSGSFATAGLPDPIVIAAGTDFTTVFVGDGPGEANLDLVDTSGYAVGDPGTATASIGALAVDLLCNMGDTSITQRTTIGNRPPSIVVPDLTGTGPTTWEIVGTQPPGLELQADGTWVGAATQLGTWTFTAYRCDADDVCFEEHIVTVEVVSDDPGPEPEPPTEAPAAVPVQGSPQLTG